MSQDKRHPKSVYDAKYPYNRCEIDECGHERHWDSTPGKERIRESHKSGTYREISHDGKLVTVAVGNQIDYAKEGKTTTVDKNHDEKIGGASRVSITGSQHKEIKGDQTSAVDGDSKIMVGKDMVSAVKGDMTTGVKGKTTLKMGDNMKLKMDKEVHTIADKVALHEYGAEVTTTAESDMIIKSKTSITIQVGGSRIVIKPDHISIVADTIYVDAEGILNLKGQNVKIGGGSEVNAQSGSNKATPPWVSGGVAPDEAPD